MKEKCFCTAQDNAVSTKALRKVLWFKSCCQK